MTFVTWPHLLHLLPVLDSRGISDLYKLHQNCKFFSSDVFTIPYPFLIILYVVVLGVPHLALFAKLIKRPWNICSSFVNMHRWSGLLALLDVSLMQLVFLVLRNGETFVDKLIFS